MSFLELAETNIGVYVKDLTIKRPRGESRNKNKGKLPPFGTRASSTRLFTRCPNLTRVIVDGCNPYYMLLSLKHAPKLDIQLDLKEIQNNKSGYDNPAVQKMYYSANVQNAATTTQLYVFDDFFSIRWPEHQQQYNNSLYTYLSQFGKLEALTTRGVYTTQDDNLELPSLLAFPFKLKKLEFDGDSLDIKDEDLDRLAIYSSLRELILTVNDLSPLHIKYIINTFPYLEKLYIYPLFRIDWSSEEGKMQIFDLFESYSAKLKDTNFRIDLS